MTHFNTYNNQSFPDFNDNYEIMKELSESDDHEKKKSNVFHKSISKRYLGIVVETRGLILITQYNLTDDAEFGYDKHFHLSLNHPNINRMIDFQVYEKYGYIIEPYGISLNEILKRNPTLSEETWLSIIEVLIDIIAYLQEQQIVHFNIETKNIIFINANLDDDFDQILTKDNIRESLRLINFSSARRINLFSNENFHITCPPSKFLSSKKIESDDKFSLGKMIYESITHKHFSFTDINSMNEDEWKDFPSVKRIVEDLLKIGHHQRSFTVNVHIFWEFATIE